ncbi:MAG: mandelate racemase/muconate lactonizing enzyme family protein [Bryobacterales bacterium]|nr:mandelate racemase/muconate lactonizing enzyme family protein [Bryobacterales bacterium]
MTAHSRRRFLKTMLAGLPAASFLTKYELMAAPEKGRVRIRDVKTMILQGPRTYTLVKVETDSGLYGIAEAYGSPGAGVREQVHHLKPLLIGQDALEIDKICSVVFERHSDGSAHAMMRALSGIEMALWDVAGKILGQPVAILLGGRYRDKVRMYDHSNPRDWHDRASVRDWAQEAKSHPSGFTGHKFGQKHTAPASDPARDAVNRVISPADLRNIRKGYENCREAIGWEHDIMVHCHWEYSFRSSVDLAQAVEPIKPLFLEDPMPTMYNEGWPKLVTMSNVPICTGENWMRRAEAAPFIVNNGCDVLNPDLRNSGGFIENRKMADMADVYFLSMCNHNTGSVVNTMATVQWAAAIRNYMVCETVVGKQDWMDDVILHDGPVVKNGFIEVPTKPGLGIELNPDVVKAHLAAGETWWG